MGGPPNYTETVRSHHPNTTGWVVATRDPCLTIQAQEVRHVQRVLIAASPRDLPPVPSLPRSWLIGVLLCPGDDTRVIADWASSLPAPEVGRVRFYHHPDLDLVAALEAWYDAGLPDPRTSEV